MTTVLMLMVRCCDYLIHLMLGNVLAKTVRWHAKACEFAPPVIVDITLYLQGTLG